MPAGPASSMSMWSWSARAEAGLAVEKLSRDIQVTGVAGSFFDHVQDDVSYGVNVVSHVRRCGAGRAGVEWGGGEDLVGMRYLLAVAGQHVVESARGGEGPVVASWLAAGNVAERVGRPIDDLPEPEAFGVSQVLDHPQESPAAACDGPPQVAFGQAADDGQNAASLRLEHGG